MASTWSGAPVGKFLFYSVISASVLALTSRTVPAWGLSLEPLKRGQLWRLVTAPFVFGSVGELAFGGYLLWLFRTFERLFGSSKYGAYVAATGVLSTSLQLSAAVGWGARLASGPHCLLGAGFVWFAADVPASTRFSVMGVPLNDKFFVYLAGLQLFCSQGLASALPAVCGALAGLAYRGDVGGLRQMRVPAPIVSAISSWLGPLMASPSPAAGARRPGPSATAGPGAAAGAGSAAGAFAAPQAGPAGAFGGVGPEPSAEAIEALVAMGFERGAVLTALRAAGGDLNTATGLLVEGGGAWR